MGAIDNTFGAALCGIIVDAWVFGLICIMSYQYYLNFPKDGLGTKLLVAWNSFVQLFNLILVSRLIYFYLITSFGSFDHLSRAIWQWALYIGLSAIAAFSVQIYYAWRTFVLTRSNITGGIISVFAVCQLGFGLATMSEAAHLVVFARFTTVSWVAVTWLAFAAACDITIALIQVLYLHTQRTGVRRTNRVINTLILYIMSTGLLTSIIAILELTTFATLGFNFVHVFLSFPMGAVYNVSFLANLDARRTVRGDALVSVVSEESMPISIAFQRVRMTKTDRTHTFGSATVNESREDDSLKSKDATPAHVSEV